MNAALQLLASSALVLAGNSSRPALLDEPLVVNGERVSEREIERYLIYGPCQLRLEMRRVQLIIDDEIERRANEAALESVGRATWDRAHGKTPMDDHELEAALAKCRESVEAHRRAITDKLTPSAAEFDAEMKRQRDEFARAQPTLDFATECRRSFRSSAWYADFVRQTMLFDRVFYPDDPGDWPETTTQAVLADSGDVLIKDAEESNQRRKEHARATGEPLPKEDGIYTSMMRQIVRDALFNTITFKTSYDGLPDELVLWADKDGDGKPDLVVTTDQMWAEVADTVVAADIELAKRWFITSMATRDRLEKDGVLLDAAAQKQALADFAKRFEGTYFNFELLATQQYRFPSAETFETYYALLESFKKMMEPKLATLENGDIAAPLREYAAHADQVMGQGQADVEVILVSAFDIPHFKWKPDGWRWAEEQARAIKSEIDGDIVAWNAQRTALTRANIEGQRIALATNDLHPYRFWTKMLKEHSEFWDRPESKNPRASDCRIANENHGCFGLHDHGTLCFLLRETPFTNWVTGESIADFVFFEQAEGTVAGPFKGPLGYYITRVQHRQPPARQLNLRNKKQLEDVKEDYIRHAFIEYAKDAVAKATVKGL